MSGLKLKSGEKVVISATSRVKKEILAAALLLVTSMSQATIYKSVEMDRYIGYENIVLTRSNQYVTFYQLENRWERIALASCEKKTSMITVALKKIGKKEYVLVDAWYGEYMPNPDDADLLRMLEIDRTQAVEFWKSHAWVRNSLDLPEHLIKKDTHHW
jgi:hypothetical protein